MALCTMSYKVRSPRKYEESLKIKEYKKELDEYCSKYVIQIISRQRMNSSNMYNVLVAFDNLNKFVEGLISYRGNKILWNEQMMVDEEPLLHILDPDYRNYTSSAQDLVSILEKALLALCDLERETPKIKELTKDYKWPKPLEELVDGRMKLMQTTIDHIHQVLHMIRDPNEKRTLN